MNYELNNFTYCHFERSEKSLESTFVRLLIFSLLAESKRFLASLPMTEYRTISMILADKGFLFKM